MGVFYESIPPSLAPWILAQNLIYIASAPLSPNGHINVSPKGGPYFGLTSSTPPDFWYIDLTGSGVETLSHLHEPNNGRICVMLNAFEGPPRIVRLWGKGEVLEYGSSEFNSFVAEEGIRERCIAGTRAIVRVKVEQVGSSCGFSVPRYEFVGFRETLNEYFEKRVRNEENGNHADGIERYWAFKNSESMDGLPGMKRGVATRWREGVVPIKKMVGPAALRIKGSSKIKVNPTTVVGMLSFLAGMLVAFVLLEFVKGDGVRDLRGGLREGMGSWMGEVRGLNEVLGNYTEEVRALFR